MSSNNLRPHQTFDAHGGASPSEPTTVTKPKTIGDLLFDDGVDVQDTETFLMSIGAKQLRTECYLRQLRVTKKGPDCNDNKMGYISLLMEQKRVFAEMQRLGVETGPAKIIAAGGAKRRSRHCLIRLVNVMFSERFANRWREFDARPTRAELDTNQTQGNSSVWTDVHTDIMSPRAEYGKLVSDLHAFRKCDPSTVMPHDAAKLRDLWKDITSRYNTAFSNSKVSGMHNNDFFSYCSGKFDLLYMHEWMKMKPDLRNALEGKIPKRARLDTFGVSDSDEDGDQEGHGNAKRNRTSKGRGGKPNVGAADVLLFYEKTAFQLRHWS